MALPAAIAAVSAVAVPACQFVGRVAVGTVVGVAVQRVTVKVTEKTFNYFERRKKRRLEKKAAKAKTA